MVCEPLIDLEQDIVESVKEVLSKGLPLELFNLSKETQHEEGVGLLLDVVVGKGSAIVMLPFDEDRVLVKMGHNILVCGCFILTIHSLRIYLFVSMLGFNTIVISDYPNQPSLGPRYEFFIGIVQGPCPQSQSYSCTVRMWLGPCFLASMLVNQRVDLKRLSARSARGLDLQATKI